ncbi:MAG: uncharacterized protein JWM80_6399 [Cyanobacteria bacterium RYN_339]|nr:uncharacterized protein [Cyanobacteria bacterium RYN_339]
MRTCLAFALALSVAACSGTPQPAPKASASATASPAASGFRLTSSAFVANATIPPKHTCDDVNVSPALAWENVPANASRLVLICDDPDAPSGTFTHWVLFDIPVVAAGMAEAAEPVGSQEGANGKGTNGYTGPCPPAGSPHHYHFKLYAVSAPLGLPVGASKDEVMTAMTNGKLIVGQTELIGTYARK